MKPITFPQANTTYKKPDGWTDEQCQDLPVCATTYENDQSIIISCWQPSAKDRERIARGEPIWLHVSAVKLHPPVLLEMGDPWAK